MAAQTTDGLVYPFHYNYNLAGGVTSLTLPSGRVVTTSYDSARRPSMIRGALGGVNTNYATGLAYATHGAVQLLTLGTGQAPFPCL